MYELALAFRFEGHGGISLSICGYGRIRYREGNLANPSWEWCSFTAARIKRRGEESSPKNNHVCVSPKVLLETSHRAHPTEIHILDHGDDEGSSLVGCAESPCISVGRWERTHH